MYIFDKLNQQIDKLSSDFRLQQLENENLKKEIERLKDQNDQLKYNNENMLLNIDKALNITNPNKEELKLL
jgi:cell division protein FtsB